MTFLKSRKWIVALVALMLVMSMAGCKGESSPTAPTVTTTGGSGGGGTTTTPPVGASLTLSVSNATPLVDSSSTITATVKSGTTPVPDGTAVEFQTDAGTFVQGATTAVQSVIRTTVGGVTSITIFSSTATIATITATVNNVTKATKVEFVAKTVITPPVATVPTITGVTPAIGNPNGGQIITITGSNFRAPLRVFFDPGTGGPTIEVPVVSFTDSTIQVVTPKINLASGQQQKFNITVITQQGTTSEQRVSSTGAFTFQLDVLTPTPTTASPASGPIDGGTRVTIFGSGFQAPVQVFFGTAEAQVIKVTFDQLIVISPPSLPTGNAIGAVDIKIINVASAKTSTLLAGFRYAEKVVVTAIAPGSGSAFGGTRVTIDGAGFDAGSSVTVSIGGLPATPIKVTGTQIIAVTSRTPIPCNASSGPTIVTNIANGDFANGPVFAYAPVRPVITNVSGSGIVGTALQVTVANPGLGLDSVAFVRFSLGGAVVPSSPSSITDAVGPTTFNVIIPINFKLPDVACLVGAVAGTQKGPLDTPLLFTNITTTCTDTVNVTVNPLASNACVVPPVLPPPAAAINPNSFCGANDLGSASVTTNGSTTGLLTVSNTAAAGSQPLVVSNALIAGPNAADFTISPTTATIPPGNSAGFIVTFKPQPPAPPVAGTQARTATLTLFTNDPVRPTITINLCGTATH